MTLSARIDVRFAAARDVPRLREIWHASFGDPQAYIDFFLHNRFVPDETMVLTVDGTVAAQLFLLPAVLRADGRETEIVYLFAAATDPAFRRRGYMRRLLDFAADTAYTRGKAAIVLLPGSAALYDYYEKCGYKTAFYRRRWDVSRKALASFAKPAAETADEAEVLRRILRGRNGIVWDDAAIRYALSEHRQFRGTFAAIEDAFVSVEGSAAAVLAQPDALPYGFDLLLRLSRSPAFSITLPPDAPYGTPERGGMIRFLTDGFPIDQAYISFPME